MLLFCTGTTLSWITLSPWRITTLAPSQAPIMAPALDAPALTWAHSLARHDHKLVIKNACICHDFVLCFFVSCCGFPTEKYARMDVWHYHLETTENWEDLQGGGGGLNYSNKNAMYLMVLTYNDCCLWRFLSLVICICMSDIAWTTACCLSLQG